MNIDNPLNNKGRIFIIPLDHPEIKDTPHLISIGKQNFVDLVDNLNHDGYIFHSYEYFDQPIRTNKDFFLTVGELPDNYLCDISKLETYPSIKKVTIFFETENESDQKPKEFYKEYITELKKKNYFVMAMGYPKIKDKQNYQHIVDIAHDLKCDAIKTDFSPYLSNLKLNGLKLFIAGGNFIPDDNDFQKFVEDIEKLKTASFSIGRNIFESKNYIDRIKLVSSII